MRPGTVGLTLHLAYIWARSTDNSPRIRTRIDPTHQDIEHGTSTNGTESGYHRRGTDNSPRVSIPAGTRIDRMHQDTEHRTTNDTQSGYQALCTIFEYKDHIPDALSLQKLVKIFSRDVDEWQALCVLQNITTKNELYKFIFEDSALEISRREAITADIVRRGVMWNAQLQFSIIVSLIIIQRCRLLLILMR